MRSALSTYGAKPSKIKFSCSIMARVCLLITLLLYPAVAYRLPGALFLCPLRPRLRLGSKPFHRHTSLERELSRQPKRPRLNMEDRATHRDARTRASATRSARANSRAE